MSANLGRRETEIATSINYIIHSLDGNNYMISTDLYNGDFSEKIVSRLLPGTHTKMANIGKPRSLYTCYRHEIMNDWGDARPYLAACQG